jgi:XTP/dITP diphosphohydrolase
MPADEGIAFAPEETGNTFLENSFIKARALYDIVRSPVIGDDSGLCVDALGGRPGIYSARYGLVNGVMLPTAERNARLLEELGNAADKRARFVCSMVLLTSDYCFYTAQTTLEGVITESRGTGGFGYDPLLYLADYGCTVAQLPDGVKNRISHRGQAARALAAFIDRL